ncbi:MAG: methylated-DNA--[protein]-cysteine S-methyltransferase [Bacilli bacterium]|nr:methylated-DNA--[protein]-cysteine S-methyltransferase [Bacilli bacterium]
MKRNFSYYQNKLGTMLLLSDGNCLKGVYFLKQKHFPYFSDDWCEAEDAVIKEAKRWLDEYFKGNSPSFLPPLEPEGTPFQKKIWDTLLKIPYGKTWTYKDVAFNSGYEKGYQAVAQAIGNNPIAIMIPCHRVVGSDGSLTGYAAGIAKKAFLYRLERGK